MKPSSTEEALRDITGHGVGPLDGQRRPIVERDVRFCVTVERSRSLPSPSPRAVSTPNFEQPPLENDT